ncbi:DegV family protein [Parageobacillus sp. VR-IP]|uniref:DegV family protein n=1 Tax=Parageobacillus sp. VR-IP TaxID=2742205 RepID=UPI001583AA4D|nr:DegV family protein [Parageobacillus sp. VR-IP]NUK30376.1 DegV family protein [Parageobacillus sp. VR-IP]
MKNVKIVTDSTVDLSKEVLEEHGIEVVPLHFTIDGETLIDRVTITPDEFMKKMKAAKELPKSSQPSAGEFLCAYDRLGEDGSEVLSIHMSGELSGTVRSAQHAANMSKANVTVVDSQFISCALGFQVLEAAQLAKEGKSVADIVSRLQIVRRHTRLYVMLDTLENLVKGGRVGRGKALVGSLLNIKPIAALDDGMYTPITNVRSYSQAVKYLTNQLISDIANKTVRRVAIAHSDALALAERLKQSIIGAIGYQRLDIVQTTPVISIHTGAGAVGLMYYTD